MTNRSNYREDKRIYDITGGVVFDPLTNHNNPALSDFAQINELERENLLIDSWIGGSDAAALVELLGRLDDPMDNAKDWTADLWRQKRALNNRRIDCFIGQASQAILGH
jgi:hypothetical protein